MDIKTIKPVGSYVLIKRHSDSKVHSDIIFLPDSTKIIDSLEAEVLAVGPGEVLANGTREPMGIVPGDKVACYPAHGFEIEKNHYIVDISMIDGKTIEVEE